VPARKERALATLDLAFGRQSPIPMTPFFEHVSQVMKHPVRLGLHALVSFRVNQGLGVNLRTRN